MLFSLEDNFYGCSALGKEGFFPVYYVEIISEEDVPRKERALFKKSDLAKEAKEAKRDKSPVPRRDRTSLSLTSPRDRVGSRDYSADSVSPRISATGAKSPSRKDSAFLVRASGRRKSGELNREDMASMQIEVNSVVLPEKPVNVAANRLMAKQPRRLSRVNPKDVKRLYEGPTFGSPLAHQMYIGYEEFVIPPILQKTTAFLTDHLMLEGLFRVSGSQDEIAEWKELFNAGKPVQFGESTSPHSVAGLLKKWLRELPEPLLTYQMFDTWMKIATKTIVRTPEKADSDIKAALNELPSVNYAVLKALFVFLSKVVDASARNLMTAENVGVVIGPNILSKENQDALASATVMPAAVQLAAYIAKNAESLFE